MSRFITIDCDDRASSFSIIRNSSFHISQDKEGNTIIEDYNTYIKDIDELRLETVIASFSIPDIDLDDVLIFLPKGCTLPEAYSKIREYLEKINYIAAEEIENNYIEEIADYCILYTISLSLEEYCKAYNSREIEINSSKIKVFR